MSCGNTVVAERACARGTQADVKASSLPELIQNLTVQLGMQSALQELNVTVDQLMLQPKGGGEPYATFDDVPAKAKVTLDVKPEEEAAVAAAFAAKEEAEAVAVRAAEEKEVLEAAEVTAASKAAEEVAAQAVGGVEEATAAVAAANEEEVRVEAVRVAKEKQEAAAAAVKAAEEAAAEAVKEEVEAEVSLLLAAARLRSVLQNWRACHGLCSKRRSPSTRRLHSHA